MIRRVAFQMERLEDTNPRATNTLLLMQEAQRRGYAVFHYQPHQISLENDRVVARCRPVEINLKNEKRHFTYGAEELIDLARIHVVHVRQDPPFNMGYITPTYFLERLPKTTLVVNDPFWVRNLPEKIYPFHFPEYAPPTLISSDIKLIRDFRARHKDIIIKPLYEFHGHGVFHAAPDDENFDTYAELLLRQYDGPLIAQKFIPQIKQGNKRIILIDGEIAGALKTVPGKNEVRVYRNSKDYKYKLNKRDREICERIGEDCRKKGLLFAGIDIIGDYLTEINVTSVGSLWRLNSLYRKKLEADIWNAIEGKCRSAQCQVNG